MICHIGRMNWKRNKVILGWGNYEDALNQMEAIRVVYCASWNSLAASDS